MYAIKKYYIYGCKNTLEYHQVRGTVQPLQRPQRPQRLQRLQRLQLLQQHLAQLPQGVQQRPGQPRVQSGIPVQAVQSPSKPAQSLTLTEVHNFYVFEIYMMHEVTRDGDFR